MKKMKKYSMVFVLSMLLFCGLTSKAQTVTPVPPQNLNAHPRVNTNLKSLWTEFNLNGSISKDKRWQYQMDIQYRRAGDASYIKGGDEGNILKNRYQTVFRPWIHYWIVPGQVRFSLSPIGYWSTFTPANQSSLYSTAQTQVGTSNTNTSSTVQPEFRICPQITLNNQYGRFLVSYRMRYEFRFLGDRHVASNKLANDLDWGYNFYPNQQGQGYGSNHQGRLRLQTRVAFAFNKPKIQPGAFYLNAWDEVFLAIGPQLK
jgi:hypothetical protein